MHFSAEFQLNPNSFKTFRVFLFFCPRYRRQTLATFQCCSYCCLCKSLARSVRNFPLHKLRIIKRRFVQELDDHSVAAIRTKRNTSECACTCWRIQERRSPWSRSLHVIVSVSFYWWVAIGCQWSKSYCKTLILSQWIQVYLEDSQVKSSSGFYRFGFLGHHIIVLFIFPLLYMI